MTPTRPFGVGWLSDRLYRVDADHGPAGEDVSVDGWQAALDTAWLQLLDVPGVRPWVEAYLDAREDDSLVVTFGDTSRVFGRGGRGYFGVSYPVDLLLAGEDQVSAMRAAIVVVLDRHVDRRGVDVPPLSSIVPA